MLGIVPEEKMNAMKPKELTGFASPVHTYESLNSEEEMGGEYRSLINNQRLEFT